MLPLLLKYLLNYNGKHFKKLFLINHTVGMFLSLKLYIGQGYNQNMFCFSVSVNIISSFNINLVQSLIALS